MAQHKPGPWWLSRQPDISPAAPEMLGALKLVSDLFTTTDNIVDPDARMAIGVARAAIAKVEGR